MITRIKSDNFNGETVNITFTPDTGGTINITGVVIPYDYVSDYPYGDYSIFIPSANKSCPLNVPNPVATPTPTITPTSTVTPTPTITSSSTPTPTPTPSPSLFDANVSISPTGATQYENVILTGSTNISSPTYIWSLTGFTDTSGNTISSYTGNPLTEGYFTSTGSSNVLLSVTGTEGSGTSTSFEVIGWTPADISPDVWIDPSDSSTVTLRTTGGTDYVESIDNKGDTSVMTGFTQSNASYQPIYSASTINASYDVLNGDGLTISMNDTGTTITGITGRTTFTVAKWKDKTGLATSNYSNGFYAMDEFSTGNTTKRWLQMDTNLLYHNRAFQTSLRQSEPYSGQPLLYTWIRENSSSTEGEYNNVDTWDSSVNQTYGFSVGYYGILTSIQSAPPLNFTQLYGEFSEMIHWNKTITDDELTLTQRYIKHKWNV